MAVQDLAFDGILGGTEEGFDVQVLFDPFEEKLYLPAAAIQIGNGLCRSGEVVGQEVESLADLGIMVFDATKAVAANRLPN